LSASIRAGVVGVGALGRHHVRVWAQLPGVKLAGVFDHHPERGQAEAEKYGSTQMANLDALIEASDVISVVSPTQSHYEVATQVVNAGVACFVEKPICATVQHAEALVDLAQSRGVPLGVGHIERYNPAVLALQKNPVVPRFIEAHRLAPFSRRGADVAVIYDLMIHDIDLLLYLTGEEPTDIRAAGASVVSDELDICNARLEFAHGAVANLTASRISSFGMRKFRIFSEASYVSLDLKDKTIEQYRLFDSKDAYAESDTRASAMPFGDRGQLLAVDRQKPLAEEMLELELQAFLTAVRNGDTPPVDGQDGLRALRVADRIHRQSRELLERAKLD
jgi:predicted dehydrogenase